MESPSRLPEALKALGLVQAVELFPHLAYLADATGRLVYVNRRWGEYTGLPFVESLEFRGDEALHPQDREAMYAAYLASIDTQTPFSYRYRLRRKDGEYRWFLARAEPVREEGTVIAWIGTLTDVQELFSPLPAREVGEPQPMNPSDPVGAADVTLRALLEASPLAVMVLDPDGVVRMWSRAAERIFGWEAQEVVGRFLPAIAAEDRPGFLARIQKVLEGSPLLGIEGLRLKKDGSFMAKIWTAAFTAPDGRRQCLSIVADISEQRAAEEALQKQLELTATITSNSTQALFMMDAQGYCTFLNPAAEQMLGFTFEEIRQRPLHEMIHHHHPDGRPYPMNECPIDRALPENFDIREHEDVFIRKNGEFFPVLVAASPIFDEQGRPISTVIEVRDVTEQRKAQQALRESEQRLLATYERAPVGIVESSPEGHYLRVNEEFCRILGYPKEELLRLGIRDVTHPQDYPLDIELHCRLVTGEIPFYRIEKRYLRKDGAVVWTEMLRSVVADPVGKALYTVGAVRDITEQKQAEAWAARLQALTGQLSAALTPQDVARVVLEQGLAAVGARAGAVVVLREARMEVLGAMGYEPKVMEVWRNFSLESPAPLATAAREGRAVWLESLEDLAREYPQGLEVIRLSGNRAWSAAPLKAGERLIGAFGLSYAQPRRFSEAERTFILTLAELCAQALERSRLYQAEHEARAKAEEALRRVSGLQRVTAALAGSEDPGEVTRIVVEEGDRILGAARGSLYLLSADGTEVEHAGNYGADWGIHRGWERFPLAAPVPVAEVIRQGRARYIGSLGEIEEAYPQLASTLQPSRFGSAALLPLKVEGRAVGVLSLAFGEAREFPEDERRFLRALADQVAQAMERSRLVFDLRQSEERYRKLSEAQKRFVADAAHELRAPLTSIQGNLEVLRRFKDMRSQDREEALAEVAQEALRLSRLVNDMLALARGDAGVRLRREPLDLAGVLRQAFAEARHLARGHRLEADLPERLEVKGDLDRLKQLALILLENALKYTPEGGRVRLALCRQADHAELRVADTGIGIAAQDLPHVFDRFYRADPSRRRDPGGTGLGLSIAKWIVEQHGGEIWLESELGQGTTAIVRLPLSRP